MVIRPQLLLRSLELPEGHYPNLTAARLPVNQTSLNSYWSGPTPVPFAESRIDSWLGQTAGTKATHWSKGGVWAKISTANAELRLGRPRPIRRSEEARRMSRSAMATTHNCVCCASLSGDLPPHSPRLPPLADGHRAYLYVGFSLAKSASPIECGH